MLITLFFVKAISVGYESMPLLQTTCGTDQQIFNWSEFQCYKCPNDLINIQGVCRPNTTYKYLIAFTNEYITNCSSLLTQFGNELVCFNTSFNFSTYNKSMNDKLKAKYYDVSEQVGSPKVTKEVSVSTEFLEQYTWAEIFHAIDPSNQTAVGFLSNACAVFNYDITSYPCSEFNKNYTQKIGGNKYSYRFWPASGPFITYGSNNPLNYILEEDYVSTVYEFGQKVNIQLARFSKYGDFLGFSPLIVDFQKCGDNNDIIEMWRDFGFNYYSQCYVDLSELVSADSTDLFDAFIEDGEFENKKVLRPIPVLLKNYRGIEGVEVNQEKNEAGFRAVRRFFLNDNYTSDLVVQHMTSFGISFILKTDRSRQIYPPLFTIEYDQVLRSAIESDQFTVKIDKETISHPQFSFTVQYVMELGSFWSALTIVFSIAVALGFVLIIYRVFMFLRTYALDGANLSVVMGILGYFFDILGTVLFVVAFSFSCYVFIFFKFQTSSFFCLPPEEDFGILIPILWSVLALKALGIIFFIIMKKSSNIFIIDWETPKERDIPISGWRRIMVANEWNRILTIRQYNVAFTVLAMAFVIGGFDLNLLSTPIPSTRLVNMDKQYIILRFAFTAFVWFVLIFFEWVWSKFVFWPIFGNPYFNFVDLCSTSNVSVLIRVSSFHGYYIHGRNCHGNADEDMDKLLSQLKVEKSGGAPKRGLIQGTSSQVFEVYFAPEFRHQLNELYNSQLAQTGAPSVFKFNQHVAGSIPHAAYETNQAVNDFLKQFFSKSSNDHHFVVQPESCLQQFLDLSPTVIEESVLTIVDDSKYKDSLIGGIELRLQLFYLVIFVCLLIPTDSPCISALVVFIIDYIIVKVFDTMGRSNLAQKTLLDDRFFL